MARVSVAQLAEICRGMVEGDRDRLLSGANTLEEATPSELSFVAHRKAAEQAAHSEAGCLLVPTGFERPPDAPWALIRVEDPRPAFVRALHALYPSSAPTPAIHPTAIIAPTASLGRDCSIGAYVTIGAGVRIGDACSIGNGTHIGDNVVIGEGAKLHANVTIYPGVRMGARVVLHSGCVLGADGFGFTLAGDHYEKFPQVGTVEIGNDVEIGANSCVDRAALGATRIGDGTKLDNLVHIAHNCRLGKHVVIAAQTGLSGSVEVGDHVAMGGQVGIADKAKIFSKAVLGAQAGIVTGQKIPAGEPVWGTPARPLRQHLRGLAHVGKLGEYRDEFVALKRKVEALERSEKKT